MKDAITVTQMNTKNLHVCEFQIKLIPYTLFKVKETSEAQRGQGATRMLQFVQLCKSRLVYPSLRRVCVCVCACVRDIGVYWYLFSNHVCVGMCVLHVRE